MITKLYRKEFMFPKQNKEEIKNNIAQRIRNVFTVAYKFYIETLKKSYLYMHVSIPELISIYIFSFQIMISQYLAGIINTCYLVNLIYPMVCNIESLHFIQFEAIGIFFQYTHLQMSK